MDIVVRFVVVVILLASSSASVAEIYKYKDEKGRWQYTDKKPLDHRDVVVDSVSVKEVPTTDKLDRSSWKNLAERLNAQYAPQSPIESATLAVVKIETILGVGSGFFVSDSGHIITNRHVIRPQTSTSWKKTERELKEEEQEYKDAFTSLKAEKDRLELMAENLVSFKHQLEYPDRYENPITQKRYTFYEVRYNAAKKSYDKDRRSINKNFREFKTRKTRLNRQVSNAAVSRSFKVIFKDRTTASAQLVRISNKQDIAVLKLNNYITPYLRSSSLDKLPQAMQVYAIGSPLGQRDSVTSGIVTRIDKDEIFTDAKILPGNSGGPLVDDQGRLLGVNTLKVMAGSARGSDGFGIAIPILNVFDEFDSIIPKKVRAPVP